MFVGSLNNTPFDAPGYTLHTPSLGDHRWRECFNSDAARYGGDNVGNEGAAIQATGGELTLVVPANALVVLRRAGLSA